LILQVLAFPDKQHFIAAKDLDVFALNGRAAAKAKNTAFHHHLAAVTFGPLNAP
jgi:hypothetical protein